MRVETPDTSAADAIADCWVALAAEQSAYDSRLLAAENRPEMRDRIARAIVTDDVRVARDGDDLVGFVMFALDTGSLATTHVRGTVHNIYVEPDRRNEGIGSELLAAAEAELADRGADLVALEAMADNEAARRFYRRHGYESHRVRLEKPVESDNHSKENA